MRTKIERITLAHISDVHLAPVRGMWPRHWNLKRILGLLNWRFNRAFIHCRDVVDALVEDMQAQNPDHIIVSGDLVNLGLPAELDAAAQWLKSLGPPERVSALAGNHDIYVPMQVDPGVARWAEYMRANTAGDKIIAAAAANAGIINSESAAAANEAMPYCRVIGPLALIGVNSAVPTPLFNASGAVGPKQREALGAILDEARRQDLLRVVAIHHPPLPGQTPRRRALQDSEALENILKTHGAELVLHGHNHRDNITWLEGEKGAMPVVGVASGSIAKVHGDEPLGRYNVIRIISWNHNVRIEMTSRGFARPGGRICDVALNSFELRRV